MRLFRAMLSREYVGVIEVMMGLYRVGGFPKISGTVLGVPIIRIIVCWGLHRGPLFVNETTKLACGMVWLGVWDFG